MEAQPKSGLSKTLYCIHCTKLAKMSFDGIFDLTAVVYIRYYFTLWPRLVNLVLVQMHRPTNITLLTLIATL